MTGRKMTRGQEAKKRVRAVVQISKRNDEISQFGINRVKDAVHIGVNSLAELYCHYTTQDCTISS